MARLASLSCSDARLVESEDQFFPLIEPVRDETTGFPGRIGIDIDRNIRLPESRACGFAPIVHELVTNASAARSRPMTARCRSPSSVWQLGNPTVRFTDRTRRTFTIRDGRLWP